MLFRFNRDADGFEILAPPPSGFPDGQHQPVFVDEAGRPTHLYNKPSGTVIETIMDHDAGILSFRVDNEPPVEALSGFPKGAALQPFASADKSVSLSFSPPYL